MLSSFPIVDDDEEEEEEFNRRSAKGEAGVGTLTRRTMRLSSTSSVAFELELLELSLLSSPLVVVVVVVVVDWSTGIRLQLIDKM